MKLKIALFSAVIAALAQNSGPQNPPDTVIRINVNLVQLDAVVHDDKDRPVTDLTKDDFEILQDGKPQAITNFGYIALPPEPGGAPTTRTAPAKKNTPPPPPIKLRPDQVRRTVALVVDDLGLSFTSTAYVRTALKNFIDKDMEPGDLVAIIRTGAGMGALQQFTADKRLLYAALDRVKFNPMGRIGVNGHIASFNEETNQAYSVGTLGAIRYVVDGLQDLPGRKSLILFSENLQLLYPREGVDPRTMEAIRKLVDAANRSSVVINSVDPRGLETYQVGADVDTSHMSQRQIARAPMRQAARVFRSQDGMVMLANDTGGLFLQNSNDLNAQVRKALVDTQGYYLIGYHPAASTFDEKTGQPKFHNVRIRMKRPGLHVRTRTGFYGVPDRRKQGVAHTRQAELAHALNSPFSSGQIHVRLTTLFSNASTKGSYLNSMLYIDAKDLRFEDEPDDWHKAVLDIVAVTFGENGDAVDSSDRTYTLRVHGDTYKHLLESGLVYSVHHPVKKPGPYQMRVALRDAASEEVGSATQFVEVPDVTKGKLTLSSIVLREDNPKPPATPPAGQAAPSATGEAEGQAASELGSPAIRIFKPGSLMLYGFQVLNAEADSSKSPSLEMQTRLFLDGSQIYEGKPMALAATGQPDPKRLIEGGEMRLGPSMKAGDYVLQVIVTDKVAKNQVATQSMDFQVQ